MSENQHQSLVEVLRERASNEPDRVFCQFLGADLEASEELTFSRLLRRAQAIAAVLQSEGCKGQTAVLIYPPGLAFIEAFFGCFFAGAIAVPVSPPDPVRLMRSLPRLRSITHDASARCLLTTHKFKGLEESLLDPKVAEAKWIETDGIGDAAADDWTPRLPGGADTAFLQYTSGSTAEPRGVEVSHANLMANERFIAEACGLSSEDRGVSWLPMYHDMGLIGAVLQPLYSGFPVRFLSPITFLRNPLSWLEAISEFEATISPAPNFAYAYCVRRLRDDDVPALDLSSWRCALNGSEPVSVDILRRFSDKLGPAGFRMSAFVPCYGLAEATLLVSGAKPADRAPKTIRVLKAALQEGRAEVAPSDDTASTRELVTCGRPSPEHRLLIADPRTGAVMPEGAIGEIWLSGPSVAEGYWRNPEETASVFSARSPSVEGGEFLRTGDLGFFIGGELVVTGRSKDLVIIRGKNHFPQDLEASAESAHPGIVPGGVAAFAVEERGEECLALAAELRTSSQAPEGFQSIEERIREAVARDHDVTVHAVALLSKRTLPKTSSGKLQRGVCRDRFTDGTLPCLHCGRLEAPERGGRGESGRGGEPEHTFTEAEIREWLVRELARRVGMGPDEIDPGKSFDAYGLDSHAAVEMLEDVELWLGYAVDSAMFYKYPTIDLLVGYLMEAHAGDEPPSSPSKAGLRRKAD